MNRMKTTFWKLIEEYSIKIPLIQRDYAHGREDRRTTQVRESFIDTLLEMIDDTSHSVDLDFIYGTVHEKELVLLDGQQRITTLWLLHCYLAGMAGEMEDVKPLLKKFSYETRATSRKFCERLVEQISGVFRQQIFGGNSLSGAIKNASWFMSSWQNDPTIKSMLVMLDVLHDKFSGHAGDIGDMWRKLIDQENPPVTFQFLPMHEHGLTEKLYIKMNARGKSLTDFEHFKAWLEEQEGGNVNHNWSRDGDWNWKERIDRQWLDMLWRNTGINENVADRVESTDSAYLNIFKRMALSASLEVPNENIEDDFCGRMRLGEFVAFSEYKEQACFNNVCLQRIFKVFDFISGSYLVAFEETDETIRKAQNLFQDFISKDGYIEQVRFYALAIFIDKLNGTDSEWFISSTIEQLGKWLRVNLNLINNSRYDNIEDFRKALISVKSLSEHFSGIHEYLADEKSSIAFFNQTQVAEEKIKAALILRDDSWKTLLEKYEKHEYFNGQIGFLLEMSKNDEGEYDQNIFKRYANKASLIFSNDLIETDNLLLQRALLATGDYLIDKSSNRSFCQKDKGSARVRDENWRRVFNDPPRRKILQELLSQLNGSDSIRNDLQTIINDFSGDSWRRYFVKCPKTINACGRRNIRFYDEGDNIYLLPSDRLSAWHAELRSYYLYETFFGGDNPDNEFINRAIPFSQCRYRRIKGGDNEWKRPKIRLDGWNYEETECVMEIAYFHGQEDGTGKYKSRVIRSVDNDADLLNNPRNQLLSLGFDENMVRVIDGEVEEGLDSLFQRLRNIAEY